MDSTRADAAYRVVPPENWSRFEVAGSVAGNVCSEIRRSPADPPLRVDCATVTLRNRNLDLDRFPSDRKWPDLLIGERVIRANHGVHFQILQTSQQPSHRDCAARGRLTIYWIPFSALPGRTVCLRSDEGRLAILQAEQAKQNSAVISARVTVWEKT